MSEFEVRVRDSFAGLAVPGAPSGLSMALDRVVDLPVAPRRSRPAARWMLLGAAAVLGIAGTLALSGGGRVPPGPTASPSALPSSSPSDSPAPSPVRIEYEITTAPGAVPAPDDLEAVAEVLRRRLEAIAAVGATVTTEPQAGIAVDLANANGDADEIRRILGQVGEATLVPLGEDPVDVGTSLDPAEHPPLLEGAWIASASADDDPTAGRVLTLTLTPDGATVFADHTADHVGEYLAIAIDGRAISVPVIDEPIPRGEVQIRSGDVGGYDEAELRELVAILGSGPLPAPIVEVR